MIVIEKLSGTKQCVLKKHIKTIDYVYETTRLICQNSIFCLSFGGEQLFYDLLKYIKSDTDICVQERDDDLYTIVELNKINKEGGEE